MLGSLAILKACTQETWQMLLGKLATVPLSSFEEADLHQLYQIYLLLEAAGDCLSSAPAGLPLECSPCIQDDAAGTAAPMDRGTEGQLAPLPRSLSDHFQCNFPAALHVSFLPCFEKPTLSQGLDSAVLARCSLLQSYLGLWCSLVHWAAVAEGLLPPAPAGGGGGGVAGQCAPKRPYLPAA